METLEKKRADILEPRLKLLNEYIAIQTSNPSNQNLQQFLASKGVNRVDFIINLPSHFKNPPVAGLKNIVAYTNAMAKEFANQTKSHKINVSYAQNKKPETLNADGKQLNADGLGYVVPNENKYNVLYGPGIYPYVGYKNVEDEVTPGQYPSLETGLEYIVTKLIPELTRKMNYYDELAQKPVMPGKENTEIVGLLDPSDGNGALTKRKAAQMYNANWFPLRDLSFLINLYKQRIEREAGRQINPGYTGGIDKTTAMEQLKKYDADQHAEMDFYKNQAAEDIRKATETKKNWWDIAKQNFNSIKEGLKNPPSQWFKDIQQEVKKDIVDIKKNAHDASVSISNAWNSLNKYNPAYAAGRGSVLSMLELNLFGMASNFAEIKKNNDAWAKALTKWKDLGGEPDKFSAAVDHGKSKKRLGEFLIKLIHKNADGSFNASGTNISAEDIQKANDAFQKEYDKAVAAGKSDKMLGLAATSLGVVAGSATALGGLVATAGVTIPALESAAPFLLAGGPVLATFIPVLNSLKQKLGLPVDNKPPDVPASEIPPTSTPPPGGDSTNPPPPPTPQVDPTNTTPIDAKTKSIFGWVIGISLSAAALFGILKATKTI